MPQRFAAGTWRRPGAPGCGRCRFTACATTSARWPSTAPRSSRCSVDGALPHPDHRAVPTLKVPSRRRRAAGPRVRAHHRSAYCPDLPGVGVIGDTKAEVEQLIREAISFHLDGLAGLATQSRRRPPSRPRSSTCRPRSQPAAANDLGTRQRSRSEPVACGEREHLCPDRFVARTDLSASRRARVANACVQVARGENVRLLVSAAQG